MNIYTKFGFGDRVVDELSGGVGRVSGIGVYPDGPGLSQARLVYCVQPEAAGDGVAGVPAEVWIPECRLAFAGELEAGGPGEAAVE